MSRPRIVIPRTEVLFWLCLLASTVAFLVPLQEPLVDSAFAFESWLGVPGDKVLHALMFCLLAALGMRARRHREGGRSSRGRVVLVVGLLGYALAIEACQHVLPWRSFEIWDVIADVVGITLGLVLRVAPRPLARPEP